MCTDREVDTSYHGIIVAVYHDGTTASEVNILLPPVTNLDNIKRNRERGKGENIDHILKI